MPLSRRIIERSGDGLHLSIIPVCDSGVRMSDSCKTKRVLHRQSLYDDVWSRPCTKIAAELGISSSLIKRICSAMNIPTPRPGYWTRVQCGKRVDRAELPKAKPGTKLEWEVNLENSLIQKQRLLGPTASPNDSDAESPAVAYPVIELASDLSHLHTLVRNTRAHERESHSRIPWDQRKERKRFDLRISQEALERAMILMDAFARGVEAQGFTFRCGLDGQAERSHDHYSYYGSQRPSGVCWVQAHDERIPFWLIERSQRVKTESDKAKAVWRDSLDKPTGLLEFNYGKPWGFPHTTSWKDGSLRKLESRLGEIVATLSPMAQFQRDERIRREREEQRRKQLENLRWQMERQKSQEKAALDEVFQNADSHRSARLLRDYCRALRKKLVERHGPIKQYPEVIRLLQWMEVRANMMDPLVINLEAQVNRLISRIPGLLPGETEGAA